MLAAPPSIRWKIVGSGSGSGGIGGKGGCTVASNCWMRERMSGSIAGFGRSHGSQRRQHQRNVMWKLPLMSVVALVIRSRQYHHQKRSTSYASTRSEERRVGK